MIGCLSFAPPLFATRCALPDAAAGRKHAHRLLFSIQVASAASSSDPAATDRLIRKFAASSSKSVSLHTLSYLLSLSSPFAFPLYERISESTWFNWNSKLTAAVVALLEKQGLCTEAKVLILESASKLKSSKDLILFYCDLIEAFSEHGLKQSVFKIYAQLQFPSFGKRPYASLIKALCLMSMPFNAEEKLKEMAFLGFRPSAFEFRLLLQSYGKMGLFEEMRRVIRTMEESGLVIDTVCANMVISCYGDHGELSEMVCWIRKMKEMGIGFSGRTYNSVLNSCPKIASMLQDIRSLPLSIEDLIKELEKHSTSANEALLVQELTKSSVLVDILGWSSDEGKLDLHGFHVASAYVIMLQWIEALRELFSTDGIVPLEISVICGMGNHSEKGGKSPVKRLVSEIMFLMNSSIRIDRKNAGRFVARGKAVKDWLC